MVSSINYKDKPGHLSYNPNGKTFYDVICSYADFNKDGLVYDCEGDDDCGDERETLRYLCNLLDNRNLAQKRVASSFGQNGYDGYLDRSEAIQGCVLQMQRARNELEAASICPDDLLGEDKRDVMLGDDSVLSFIKRNLNSLYYFQNLYEKLVASQT